MRGDVLRIYLREAWKAPAEQDDLLQDFPGHLEQKCDIRDIQSWWKSFTTDKWGLHIEFPGKSLKIPEGEAPCFWQVQLESPPGPASRRGSFLGALNSTLKAIESRKAETIREILSLSKQALPVRHELSFTTREDALNHHQELARAVRKHERLILRKGPEKAQALLAELSEWCAERRGRLSELARAIGVSPQAVNDWLNGRKKMTGEQALRVNEFVAKTRKRRGE